MSVEVLYLPKKLLYLPKTNFWLRPWCSDNHHRTPRCHESLVRNLLCMLITLCIAIYRFLSMINLLFLSRSMIICTVPCTGSRYLYRFVTARVHNSCDSGISVLNYCHSWDKLVNTQKSHSRQ